MNVTQASATRGGALQGVAGTTTVDTPITVSGRPVFRRVFFLRLPTGGLADALALTGGTALTVRFRALDHTPAVASLDVARLGDRTGLLVALDAPERVMAVTLDGGGTVQLHRMDGDRAADEASITVASGAAIDGDFTDLRFAVRRQNGGGFQDLAPSALETLALRGYPAGPRLGLMPADGSAPPAYFTTVAGEVGRAAPSRIGKRTMRKTSGGGDPGLVRRAGLKSLIPQEDAYAEVAAGDTLRSALQRLVAALPAPLPATVETALVVESDAPFRADITAFAVAYHLSRSAFRALLVRPPDLGDGRALAARLRDASTPLAAWLRAALQPAVIQRVDRAGTAAPAQPLLEDLAAELSRVIQGPLVYQPARFAGVTLSAGTLAAAQAGPSGVDRVRVNRALLEEAFPQALAPLPPPPDGDKLVLKTTADGAPARLAVDVPRASTLVSATIEVSAPKPGAGPAGDGWDAAPPGDRGALADGARVVAQQLAGDGARRLSGIALALQATAPPELRVEVREDAGGLPAGRVLAAAALPAPPPARPAWVHAAFDQDVVLTSRPYWLVLKAARGSAVWLAVAGEGSVRVGDRTPDGKGWIDRAALAGLVALYQPFAPAAGDAPPALRLVLGAASLAPSPAGDRLSFDLRVPLAAAIAAAPAADAVVSVPLALLAPAPTSLTVYPPTIVYDLQ